MQGQHVVGLEAALGSVGQPGGKEKKKKKKECRALNRGTCSLHNRLVCRAAGSGGGGGGVTPGLGEAVADAVLDAPVGRVSGPVEVVGADHAGLQRQHVVGLEAALDGVGQRGAGHVQGRPQRRVTLALRHARVRALQG